MLRPRASRPAFLAALAAGAIATAGCGTTFKLPTERPGKLVPADGSYELRSVWTGFHGVGDILLTQGGGSQLYVLFKTIGTDTGKVLSYPLSNPAPFASIRFKGHLLHPVAMATGSNKVYVLDQGDTCVARRDTLPGFTNDCGDRPGWPRTISDLGAYWRVHEYGLLGGDTLSSFTDTTLIWVNGVAADDRGNVYVSGRAQFFLINPFNILLRIKVLQYRIYRYHRRATGEPDDRNMPGSRWARDASWAVEEGSGIGSVLDPRGIHWGSGADRALYAADFGQNRIQKLSDVATSTGFFQLDGAQTGKPFRDPLDVTADLQGYVYLTDTNGGRVLRYDRDGLFVQTVNTDTLATTRLQRPVAVAADDSLVYVADDATDRVLRYKRRP